ncbi:MFS transporter [Leptolinea tardivitalis]|nr:MFS transporter [Leptolinea tardivitalis]GAP20184.1 arabinose efflux permease [Leptolinea tardivitalis]
MEINDKIEESPKTWLNRNVIGMALASFFSDAGHEAATSILPLFLISIGAPAASLGFIEGVADAVSSFVKLGAGWFSDRIGRRKPIAVLGYLLTGITTGLFALAHSWGSILLIRTVGWFGRGIRGPVRDAMLAESVSPEARGRAFGFHRAGDTLGAVTGPILALGLTALLAGHNGSETTYRQIFWITLIPGILSALSFAFFIKEQTRTPARNGNLFQTISTLPKRFKIFLIGVGIFGAGDFAHSLLTLRAIEVLTPDLGAKVAGQTAIALYILHNVFYAGMSYPIGALSDRIGKRGLLTLGYLLAAIMGIGWIVSVPSVWMLGLLFGLGGTFIAAEDALEGALAADLLPEDVRGTGYGVLATINGLGDFLSSVIVGALWSAFNPIVGFTYATVLFALGALIIYKAR